MRNFKFKTIWCLLFMMVTFCVNAQRNVKQEEVNKKLVLNFYQKLFGDKDLSVIDPYIAVDYIQHNPTMADGTEELRAAVTQWFAGALKEKVDIPHVAADGELIFLHVRAKNPKGGFRAIVDIFRVTGKKIVEHWDVIHDVPSDSVNDHPMF